MIADNPTSHPLNGKKILSIDYGSKVIGLAHFHHGHDPFPLIWGRIIVYKNPHYMSEILALINEEEVELAVIGLPLDQDYQETAMSKQVRDFAAQLLKKSPQIKIEFQDEHLSTKEAESRMKTSPSFNFKIDKQRIDEVSALIILEDYIKKNS